MSVLCANGCHVYRVGPSTGPSTSSGCNSGRCSARCTCGLHLTKFPLSGGVIPSYNPFGPPRPPTPVAGQGADVSIKVFEAAQRAGASHLSMDGKLIYCQRFGEILVAEWDGEKFGSWWNCDGGLPADAVAM